MFPNSLIKRNQLNPPKVLVLGFVGIILLGSLLLTLPVATRDGKGFPWLDAFFTATSATCVTGLVVVDTGTTFSLFGQLVILSLIQIGGLGLMTFATLFAILLGKRISLKERLILQQSLNNYSVQGIVRLVKRIILFTAVIELTGGLLLGIRFAFDMPMGKALYYGIFHAVSSFNNAGFDLMGNFRSLTGYVEDPLITLVVSSLIILGGIGFIVMNEIFEYRQSRRLTLHTKVVLIISVLLIGIGTLMIFLFERSNPKTLQPLSPLGKFLASFFHAVSPRTAGFNTLNIPDLTKSSLFLTIILMFIGASPGSTGGGIKTTTFAILIGTVWSQITGKEDVAFFRQRIVYDTIYKSLTVILSGLFIVITVTMCLAITESGADFLMILFEATSAFGTVGLSMGLTPELSPWGKILIILTMFAGRVGPLTLAYALARRKKEERFKYPKGKIMIG